MLSTVLGISVIVVITVNKGIASTGNPKMLTTSISPISQPPATGAINTPTTSTVTNKFSMFDGSAIFPPSIPVKNATFTITDNTEPSLCILIPKGITVSAISSGTPIFLLASKLDGIQAELDDVARAVAIGLIEFS